MNRFQSVLRDCFVALLATAAGFLLRRVLFVDILNINAPWLPYLIAVAAISWLAGVRAGLLTTGLSAATVITLALTRGARANLAATQEVRLVLFLLMGGLTAWLVATLRSTQRRLASERQQVETEVTDRFRKLATFAPVGIFHTDALGSCLFVNDTWCKIAGATPEQALGLGWANFLHPDDRQRVVSGWHEAAQLRRDHFADFRVVNRDTGTRWVSAAAIALFDEAGNVSGYVGTVVDFTERKAVEDVIRADEARLRSILDNTPAVISLKDLSGRYVLVNRGWEQLYGVTNEQIAGLTNFDLLSMTSSCHMSPGIAKRFAAVERTVIDTGAPVESEDQQPDGADGRIFFTVKFPIKDAAGTITGVGGISTEISERRKAVDALKAEQQRLSQAMELQDNERQLIAYEIHDGIIQYTAGALMQLESLKSLGQSGPVANTVEKVAGSLRRAVADGRRLINGLRTPVLDDLGVAAAVENLLHEEDRAHVTVEYFPDRDLGRMDPKIEEALYRITQEALTNICKHSRSEHVRIELARRGDRVHLEVCDQGIGFSPEHWSKETLGLRGMTERAKIAGGTCHIESSPGKGTRVVVDLPYRAKMPGAIGGGQPPTSPEPAEASEVH